MRVGAERARYSRGPQGVGVQPVDADGAFTGQCGRIVGHSLLWFQERLLQYCQRCAACLRQPGGNNEFIAEPGGAYVAWLAVGPACRWFCSLPGSVLRKMIAPQKGGCAGCGKVGGAMSSKGRRRHGPRAGYSAGVAAVLVSTGSRTSGPSRPLRAGCFLPCCTRGRSGCGACVLRSMERGKGRGGGHRCPWLARPPRRSGSPCGQHVAWTASRVSSSRQK